MLPRPERIDRQESALLAEGETSGVVPVWREGGGSRGGVQRSAAECRAVQGPAVLHTVDPSTNLLPSARLLGLTGPQVSLM